ncbi:MAG: hypothetical protein R3F29_10115 [Planctomycetota bacterium]
MRRLSLLCLPAAVVAVQIPSQSTLSVGPGGFPQIRDALAAAQPGDTLLVQPGTYAHFDATIGVTIRAAVPGTVEVVYDPAFTPPGCQMSLVCMSTEGPTHLAPPSGQPLHVIGLNFLPTATPIGLLNAFHRVAIDSGTVTMDDCVIRSAGSSALSVTDAVVSLQGCTIRNESANGVFSSGALLDGATVTMVDCTVIGGPASPGLYPGGDGLRVIQSSVHASGLLVRGGSSQMQAGGPAVRAASGAIWISDSQLEAGNAACAVAVTSAVVQLARCNVVNASLSCGQPATAPLLGVHRPQPLTLGGTFVLEFRTDPNGFVFLSASPDLIGAPLLETVQPLSLHPASLVFAGVFFADANGVASGAWNVPNNPALVDATLWFQGATGFSFPLQMTPVAGGVMR